ncbi:MAG: SDR family oxidoreductase [Clostridiales bacterium]|nr:SDR family oxidoreductase [Clostridiales bacterium]
MKNVVVVGLGKSGLGDAIATRFARENYGVVVMDFNDDYLKETTDKLTSLGCEVHAIKLNLMDSINIRAAFEEAASYGQIASLIYVAAARRNEYPSKLTREHMEFDFSINVGAIADCVQNALPYLENCEGSSILLTGGRLALAPELPSCSLSLCKAAIRNYLYALHEDLAEKGIFAGTVTIFNPIKPNTDYAPEKIAELFWSLHSNRKEFEIKF